MKREKNESCQEYKTRVARRLAEDKQFYDDIAVLLGTTHDYHVPFRKRTRWNARTLGNGRYPGFGTIQCFGSNVRVILKKPVKITRMFNSKEDVLRFLRDRI